MLKLISFDFKKFDVLLLIKLNIYFNKNDED